MFLKSLKAACFMNLMMASTVFAHSGHGSAGWESGLMHYLSQPVHIGMALAWMGCFIFVIWVRKTINGKNEWE